MVAARGEIGTPGGATASTSSIMSRLSILAVLLISTFGCQLIPDVAHQPAVHNPFPQLSRVAVAPFFNHSDDETVDGRQFAMAYYAELQDVPGFEVVPLSVVEEAMQANQISLNDPDGARRLAKVLGVDAVVIGAVTDFKPYYPPRCGLRVEWYTANPGFHTIPAGYGLPWGTSAEEYIPAPLVFEAEMALAREQLKTQTPACDGLDCEPSPASEATLPKPVDAVPDNDARNNNATLDSNSAMVQDPFAEDDMVRLAQAVTDNVPEPEQSAAPMKRVDGTKLQLEPATQCVLPPQWPDERGFIPPGPSPVRPPCRPHEGPVMTHTQIYRGNDAEFTEALASYYHFRDDARFGGWQSYMQRSDDFIRFCCHLHIAETLTARGGGGETRVVWRWSESR